MKNKSKTSKDRPVNQPVSKPGPDRTDKMAAKEDLKVEIVHRLIVKIRDL